MTAGPESPERALEEAVSRGLRDNLVPLERTASELQQAFAELMATSSGSNPGAALPAILRAQALASSLSASLSVFSNFVAMAMSAAGRRTVAEETNHAAAGVAVAERAEQTAVAPATVSAGSSAAAAATGDTDTAEAPQTQEPAIASEVSVQDETAHLPEPAVALESPVEAEAQAPSEHDTGVAEAGVAGGAQGEVQAAVPEALGASEPVFDVSTYPVEIQDLHRRANRVAKVAMQDIKLLRPNDVQLGREHKDICERLRSDLDKARKEYDRRFRAVQDHPVDYFHRWMVDILAEGNLEALGEYPYPSPVLRH